MYVKGAPDVVLDRCTTALWHGTEVMIGTVREDILARFPLQLLFCKFVVATVDVGFIVDVPDSGVMRRRGNVGAGRRCLRDAPDHVVEVDAQGRYRGRRQALLTVDQWAELREARRRACTLKQENEVLRRAAAYLWQADLPGSLGK